MPSAYVTMLSPADPLPVQRIERVHEVVQEPVDGLPRQPRLDGRDHRGRRFRSHLFAVRPGVEVEVDAEEAVRPFRVEEPREHFLPDRDTRADRP